MPSITIIYIVLAFVVAFSIAIFQYVNAIKNKEKVSYLLTFLRFISIFLIGILLINPKVDQIELKITKPSLVVAIDDSKSIANFNQEQQVLDFLDQIKSDVALNQKFNIDYYSFGAEVKTLDSLSFSYTNTGVSKALSELKRLYKNDNAPVLLVSDGNQTIGKPYEYFSSNQPIYSVVVGDTVKYEDLNIYQLNVNRYTFLKNKFPVEVFINYSGTNKISQQLSVFTKGRRVHSEILNFDADKTSNKVSFFLEGTEVGLHYYSVDINPLPNEKNLDNNKKSFAVEVIDEQSKTLILASFLHPDLGALKESIEQNKQRKAEIKIIGDDIDLEDYQSVLLYQPTQAFASAFELLNLMNFNYGIITGSKTDWNFLNSVQSDFRKNVINQTENYRAFLNPSFSSFNVTDIDVQSFPPLVDKFGEVEFIVKTDILMWQQIGDYVKETPLLATYQDDNSRKFILLGEGIWRWRMASYSNTDSFEKFDGFMSKLTQYLSASNSKKSLMVEAEPLFYLNSNNSIKASFLNKNYELDKGAAIWLELTNKQTKETKRIPFSLVGNSYSAQLVDITEGEHNYKVTVENQKETFNGTFRMLNSDIEAQFKSSNIKQLRDLSERNNGVFYTLINANNILEDLLTDTRFRSVESKEIKSKSFIEWQWLLGLIILSLSIEWFIRKYNGLI